jgi:hypothetical protein
LEVTIVLVSCHNEILMSTFTRHDESPDCLTPAARWAGFLGLLPFVLALGLVMLGGSKENALLGLRLATAWGAVILAFIAAVHWGLAVGGRLSWSIKTIVGSTAPSVVGAVAVLVGGEKGIALLVAGFGLFWLFEHRTYADALPADYLDLRRALTMGVCTLLILTAFAASGALT